MRFSYICAFILTIFLSSCQWPEYVGTYYSTNCNMLERVEIFPDQTIDLRYFGMGFSVNRPARIHKNIITVLNRESGAVEYEFEYKSGALYEISGMDLNCILKKDTLK